MNDSVVGDGGDSGHSDSWNSLEIRDRWRAVGPVVTSGDQSLRSGGLSRNGSKLVPRIEEGPSDSRWAGDVSILGRSVSLPPGILGRREETGLGKISNRFLGHEVDELDVGARGGRRGAEEVKAAGLEHISGI